MPPYFSDVEDAALSQEDSIGSDEEEELEEAKTTSVPALSAASGGGLPKLLEGRITRLGGGRRELFCPFQFAGRNYLLSSLPGHANVAVLEQVFEKIAPKFCSLFAPPPAFADAGALCAIAVSAVESGVKLGIAWQNLVQTYCVEFNPQTQDYLWTLESELHPKERSKLTCMDLSQTLLVLGFASTMLQVWNTRTRELIFANLDYECRAVSFSPNGRMFATLDAAQVTRIRVWYRNKNSNDVLSSVEMECPHKVVELEWRPSRLEAANTLLARTVMGQACLFQEADFGEDFGFYPLYRLEPALAAAAWVYSSYARADDRLLWVQQSKPRLNSKWAEMDLARTALPQSSLEYGGGGAASKDLLLCLTLPNGQQQAQAQVKVFLLQGLGQSPRVAVRCQVESQRTMEGLVGAWWALECKLCFTSCNNSGLWAFVQQTKSGQVALVDFTKPLSPQFPPHHQAKMASLLYCSSTSGAWLAQDESNRVCLWREDGALVWERECVGPLDFGAVSMDETMVALATRTQIQVFSLAEFGTAATRSQALSFPIANAPLIGLSFLPDGALAVLDSHACLLVSVQDDLNEKRVALPPSAHSATCLAGLDRETIWIGTNAGEIYLGEERKFEVDGEVGKMDAVGVWLAALVRGEQNRCVLGSLDSKQMQALALDQVVDFSLCEFAPDSYSLIVLQRRGTCTIFCPTGNDAQYWQSRFETTFPEALALDRITCWGRRGFLAHSTSCKQVFWQISGETTTQDARPYTDFCLQLALPEYHPRLLLEYFRLGETERVGDILKHLGRCLKESTALAVEIPTLAESLPQQQQQEDTAAAGSQEAATAFSMWTTYTSSTSASTDWLDELEQALPRRRIAGISPTDSLLVLNACHLYRKFTRTQNYRALDTAGMRFALAVENHKLAQHNKLKSSEVIWALHSTTQQNLIQLFVKPAAGDDSLIWERDLASIGAGYWMESASDCTALFERLAKAAHVRNPKEPFDSLLFYCALNKPRISSALFKLAGKAKLATLLAMDFANKEESRVIAVKNAYACMEKKMFKEAAAFFILGGKEREALRVLARNLGDCQLALMVGRVTQAKQAMELILREFTWEIGLAMKDAFFCAIAQTLLLKLSGSGGVRSAEEEARCFLPPPKSSTPGNKQQLVWLVEFATKHEAIAIGQADPLMSVLFLRHLRSDLDLEQECGVYYLKERMPSIAQRFLKPAASKRQFSPRPHSRNSVVEALYYCILPAAVAQASFETGLHVPIVGEEICQALFKQDFARLVSLLFNKQPVAAEGSSGVARAPPPMPRDWRYEYCSNVLVLLILERALRLVAQGRDVDFVRALEHRIQLTVGRIKLCGPPASETASSLQQVVSSLLQFRFTATTAAAYQQEVWELLQGPQEMERFALRLAAHHRKTTAMDWRKQSVTSYTLYSKSGLNLASLALVGEEDSTLVLASAKQGLREFDIHSSLTYRARTVDGRALLDAERDSFVGMQQRFQVQEKLVAKDKAETWQERLLAKALLGRTYTFPAANTSAPQQQQQTYVRGDRDHSVSSKIAVRPNNSTYAACGQDGKVALWRMGTEAPTALLTNFSQHSMTLVRYSPLGTFLLGVDTTGSCALYDDEGLAFFHTMPFKPSSVTDAAFLSNTVFATTNTEGKVSVFDSLLPPKSCMVASWHHPRIEDKRSPVAPATACALTRVVYSPRLECLLTGSARGTLFAVDMRKCIALQQTTVTNKPITALALSNASTAGHTLAAGSGDGTIRLWSLAGDAPLLGEPSRTLLEMHVGAPATTRPTFFKPGSQMNLIANSAAAASSFTAATPVNAANVVADLVFSSRDEGALFSCGSDGTVKLSFCA